MTGRKIGPDKGQLVRSNLKRSAALALVLALAACGGGDTSGTTGGGPSPGPTPTPSPSPSPTPTPTPTGGGSISARQQDMLDVMITEHNQARAEVGVSALSLDADLNQQALAYAEELAASGNFQHSPASSRPNQGENLWAGTANAFQYEDMVGAWIAEKQFYIHDRFPYVSSTGRWQDVGHYTQIIWRDTKRLGCGIATGAGRDVLVCRYSPPGNVSGQFAY